jgi:hypothetical protein
MVAKMNRHQEKMETCLEKAKEPTSVEMKCVAVHEGVYNEDAALKPVGALRKQHRDRNMVAGRHEKAKERGPGLWRFPEEIGCRPQRDDQS